MRRVGAKGQVTMKSVADVLGVDVTTLYRHVGGVDQLREMWASESAPDVSAWPSAKGETWESWLALMAQYYRAAMIESPDLIEYAHQSLDPDFERLEEATRILVEFGFEPRVAAFAHGFLINNVIGFVHQELRVKDEDARGRPVFAQLFQALEAQREDGRLETLESLELGPKDFDSDTVFERFIGYAIDGLRAQRSSR